MGNNGLDTQVGLLVFGAVFTLFVGAFLLRSARRARVQDALRKRLGTQERAASLLREEEKKNRSGLETLVIESGLGWTMSMLVGRMVGCGVLGLVVGAALSSPFLAVILGFVGVAIFPFIAHRARERRLATCDTQMPQALEIMSLALRAGHPLPTALAIAASEAPSPIAEELQHAVDENELGRPVGDVLVNLGKRLPGSEAVHTFIVAVLVLQQTGGNLIAVIDRIVENARARAQYRAKLKALTAEGRSSAKMLGVMPVAFGLIAAFIDPQYTATLFSTGSGNIVLVVSILLWLIGLLWTRSLVKVDS